MGGMSLDAHQPPALARLQTGDALSVPASRGARAHMAPHSSPGEFPDYVYSILRQFLRRDGFNVHG
jgi:hypothetical protein